MGNFSREFLGQAQDIIGKIDGDQIERVVDALVRLRAARGRLFFLGCGGSAGNCSHAVNDFRKISGIECYAPTDNVSELTARTNDEGWESVFVEYLKVSHLTQKDALFIFSVGGGDLEKNISANIVKAIDYAENVGAGIFGVVGRDGGHTAKRSKDAIVIPPLFEKLITPFTESFGLGLAPYRFSSPFKGGGNEVGICLNMMGKAVFFDRDGVINRPIIADGKPFPPRTVEEFIYMDGVGELFREMDRAFSDFKKIILTNQPDISRKLLEPGDLDKIHLLINNDLNVDEIFVCCHDDEHNCNCRKPKIGMFLQARDQYALNLSESYMIGDRWRDVDSGNDAGCRTIFLDHGYTERLRSTPDFVIKSLKEVIPILNLRN